VQQGDLVLTDTSPWIDGAWSDTANAVYVGHPDSETRRRFDAIRRALAEGISLCRPGAVAKDVDRKVRDLLSEHGPTYSHHTGHGIGAAWSEEPRITPYNDLRIEEGMVLALEPAIYQAGWGGIRLEHVFRVGTRDNEILTLFEHTL
jgi:Xaa-Pro aminopeptidase